VTITVSAASDAPVALAQEVGLAERTSAHVTLAGSDADGDALTFYATTLPANGLLSIIDPLTSVETVLTAANLWAGPARWRFRRERDLHAGSRRPSRYRRLVAVDAMTLARGGRVGGRASLRSTRPRRATPWPQHRGLDGAPITAHY
jgi:hypothetical protein